LFNRGNELRKSLIDATKVRQFIETRGVEVKEEKKNDKQEWADIMSYLKSNPKALLDAIPTPRGDEEKLLKEFKKGMDMKFNDIQSTMSFRQSKNYTFGMQGGNSGINTPSKRLQSPKVGPSNIISSRKLNSSSRLHDALLNASSSRKSLSSPKTNPYSRPLQPPSSYFDKPYANLLQDYQLPSEFSVPNINAPSI